MATDEGSGAPASRKPDRIPSRVVFDDPPGVEGTLTVGAEEGDITVHTEIDGKPFSTMVLTMDDALTLSMWLCAHIVDERRRRQP